MPVTIDQEPEGQKAAFCGDMSLRTATIVWWLFAGCIVMSFAAGGMEGSDSLLVPVLTVAGSAGCAWSWLFTRTLFRTKDQVPSWAIALVGAVIVIESAWALQGSTAGLGYAIHNAASMICIAALVLVFVEVLAGYRGNLRANERRFRQVYASLFGVMVFIALIVVSGAEKGSIIQQWQGWIITMCALAGLVGSRLALNFRQRNPLSRRAVPVHGGSMSEDDLAAKILAAASDLEIISIPGLKVAEFSKLIGEQDYKVTRSITSALGYQNFNQFINARRVELARNMLADPQHSHLSVASIAYQCGFGSIGPFNRAFRQFTGETPTRYRISATGQAAE